MKRVVVGLAAMMTLVASAPAMAQDWSETFHPDSLPEELSEIRVVVATGGPGSAQVGRALRANLREAGSPMVIDNPVMGDVEGVADQDVIERLKHLPVDAIVIVRTFDDEQGAISDAREVDLQASDSLASLFREADAEPTDAEPSSDNAGQEGEPEMVDIVTDDPALIAKLKEAEVQQRREETPSDDAQTLPSDSVDPNQEDVGGGLGMRGTLSVSLDDGPTASMAMITFYSIEGAAIAGFMVYPGVPLTSEQRQNIGRGISQEAVDATQSAIESVVVGKGDSTTQPQSGRLRLQNQGRTWQLHDTETGETSTHADIYRTLGRDDLASTYEANARSKVSRTTLGRITGYAGLGVLAAGSALAISTYFRQFPADDPAVAMCNDFGQPAMQNNCRARESFDALSGQRITGLSLAGVGLAAAITGLVIRGSAALYNPHPLSLTELRDVVHKTNTGAASQGGGGVSSGRLGGQTAPQTDDAEGMRLELSPYFQGGPDTRGGLQLRGRW